MFLAKEFQPEGKLWLAFGTGQSFRYIDALEVAAGLGREKAGALPLFHALTGCDTASNFHKHDKKTAWAVWTVLPELTETLLLLLFSVPCDIPDDAIRIIERLVILLHDQQMHRYGQVQKETLCKKNNVLLVSPKMAALEEHVKKAVYQGGQVWGQILLPAPELPRPTNWGWSRTGEGQYTPYWSRLTEEAAHSCIEQVSCKCKNGRVGCCKCKKAGLKCTDLCEFEADCTWR